MCKKNQQAAYDSKIVNYLRRKGQMKNSIVMTKRLIPLHIKSQRNGRSKLHIVTSCTNSGSLPETISYCPLDGVPLVKLLIKRSPCILLSSVPSWSKCDRWTLRLTSLNQLKHTALIRFGSTRSSPSSLLIRLKYAIRSTCASKTPT